MSKLIDDTLFKAICQFLSEQPAVALFTEMMKIEVAQPNPEQVANLETKPLTELETK